MSLTSEERQQVYFMTPFRRVLLVVAALAIAARILNPLTYQSGGQIVVTRVDTPATLLQVLMIALVTGALFIAFDSRTMVYAVGLLTLVCLGLGGWLAYGYIESQKTSHLASHPSPPLDDNQIVEGQRFGPVRLGMTVAGVRRALATPIQSASTERKNHAASYSFRGETGWWEVVVDTTTGKAVTISYGPPLLLLLPQEERERAVTRVPFETVRGARYGHGIDTITTLYGDAKNVHGKGDSEMNLWYPDVATELTFTCMNYKFNLGQSQPAKPKPCENYEYEVSSVGIYGGDWRPGWVK